MDFTFLSYIAAFLTTSSTLPQIFRILKTKGTGDLSMNTYIAMVVGIGCWAAYGFYKMDFALIIANVITFVFNAIILGFIIRDRIKRKQEAKVLQ